MMSGVSIQRLKMLDGLGQSEYRDIAQSTLNNCFMMSGVSIQRLKMFDGLGQSEYRNIAQSTLKIFNPTVCFTVIGIIMLNKLLFQFWWRF